LAGTLRAVVLLLLEHLWCLSLCYNGSLYVWSKGHHPVLPANKQHFNSAMILNTVSLAVSWNEELKVIPGGGYQKTRSMYE